MKPGLYKHYKGKFYTVISLANHTETQEMFVVYRQEYGDQRVWIRPYDMFYSKVIVDGVEVPRFEYMGDSSSLAWAIAMIIGIAAIAIPVFYFTR